jgi:hypothetical protein
MLPPGLSGRRARALARGEVEVLPWRAPGWREGSDTKELDPAIPPVWVPCPPCAGTGRMGGRACLLCEGSGELNAAVAMDPDDPEAIEAGPTAAG